jgi:methyltransferase family protein
VLRRFASSGAADSYANRLREQRFALFRTLLSRLTPPVSILDVGGTPRFWELRGDDLPNEPRIVVINLEEFHCEDPRVTARVGNALDMSDLPDQSFDVVFSNSVIEHVETLENQYRMAAEIRRVGQRYFVQTPNKFFPLEPHFLFPGYQFLPISARVAMLRRMPLGWYPRTPDAADAERKVRRIRLMTEKELRIAFPGAHIYHERFYGLTKSIIAYGGW